MEILLTNDDGIHAEGLWALYERLVRRHSVTVVAPDRERSAVGHGITLDRPLRVSKLSVNGGLPGFAVTGTPADCIKLGVVEILEKRPDLVISGINPGTNVGINIHYSGTVAAAREAALNGLPALAISVQGSTADRFQEAAVFAERLAAEVSQNGLPAGTFLNVNLPDLPMERIAGVQISRMNLKLFSERFEKRTDPRNRLYFWQGSDSLPFSDSPDIDGDALSRNYISITPVKCDMTDYEALDRLKTWNLST